MNKNRAKAIKLYWSIAKERCPFHEEEMVNSFLEGFIDCAEYLLLQNTDLEKENTELKAQLESERDLPAIAYMQGAEKQKKKDEEELKKWKDEWQEQVQKATDEGYARTLQTIQLSKAKELLKRYVPYRQITDSKAYKDLAEETEQFLKENSTYERIQKAKYNYTD